MEVWNMPCALLDGQDTQQGAGSLQDKAQDSPLHDTSRPGGSTGQHCFEHTLHRNARYGAHARVGATHACARPMHAMPHAGMPCHGQGKLRELMCMFHSAAVIKH